MLMEKLQADLLQARKARQPIETGLLTALVGEAKMVGKNAGNRQTTDAEALAMVKKFLKNAEETKNRLAEHNKDTTQLNREIEVLQAYVPQQLTVEELTEAIKNIIATVPNINIGTIMKELKAKYGTTYDGRKANEIAKTLI